MCGITGLINWADGETLSAMTDLLEYRGPDDRGIWERHFPDGTYVGLGNRRLKVIDLSVAGRMPMSNEAGDVWITYNGEIYNFLELRHELEAKGYTFRSHTDTEVLLHLYEEDGPSCVQRLDGMFAFAICDFRTARTSPTVVIARDHFGVKPLYFIQDGRRVAFASEAKALLQLPGFATSVDLESLHRFLTFLWVPEPDTLFRGIQKLLPGHYAVYRDGRCEVVQYWDLSFPPAHTHYVRSEAELVEAVREQVSASVRRQIISDVPVGALLSSGLDSSSIVAMIARNSSQSLHTYTITFPEQYRVGEVTLDDPAVAARFAQQAGCIHQEIVVEPGAASLLPKLVWHMDDPVADPAIITAFLVCRAARESVTVLLSGIGGDELFAGYRKYTAHYWSQAYRRLPFPLRGCLIEPAVAGLPSLRGTRFKGYVRLLKKMSRSGSFTPQDEFIMNSTYLDSAQKDMLYSAEMRCRMDGFDPWLQHRDSFSRVASSDFLNQMLYVDSKIFMPSLNLNYGDKMSMASSVELRVPFLDRDLAAWAAWDVPAHSKLAGPIRNKTKHIFRQAMQGLVPDEVLRQRKAGFGAPVDYWLAHDLKEMVDDLLSEDRIKRRGYFEATAIQNMIREQRSGRQDWSMQIWQLLTLELWMQAFIDAPQHSIARNRA